MNLCTRAEYISKIMNTVSKTNLQIILDKIAKFKLTAKNTYQIDPKSLEESFVIMIHDKILTTIETYLITTVDPSKARETND